MKEIKTIKKSIELKVFSKDSLSDELKKLCDVCIKSANNAYAVYSKFRVGSAVLLDDGHIVSGNNQENVAFPSGLCAERTVLFYTHANFPDKKIKAIAIYSPDAKNLLTPCGACRQVMIEYENIQNEPIQTIIISEKEVYVLESVKDWLPFEFSENLLK
jgi:cytidine deaminase